MITVMIINYVFFKQNLIWNVSHKKLNYSSFFSEVIIQLRYQSLVFDAKNSVRTISTASVFLKFLPCKKWAMD